MVLEGLPLFDIGQVLEVFSLIIDQSSILETNRFYFHGTENIVQELVYSLNIIKYFMQKLFYNEAVWAHVSVLFDIIAIPQPSMLSI